MTQQASCSNQPHPHEADHEIGIGGGVDHIDALTATITRTEAIVAVVIGDEFTEESRQAQTLLWQVQENLRSMSRSIDQFWNGHRGEFSA